MKTQVSKYLIGFVVIVYFMVIFLVGCNPYHSKSRDNTRVEKTRLEEPFVDYSYGDFEEVVDNDVYHVKYVHITL